MTPSWLPALRFLGLGWVVVLSILVGLVGGLWLDRRLDTTPLFMLIGLALGLGAAARSTYRMIKEARVMQATGRPRSRPRRGRR